MNKLDVVLLEEVVVDRPLLLFASLTILIQELRVLRMSSLLVFVVECEALDLKDLCLCRKVSIGIVIISASLTRLLATMLNRKLQLLKLLKFQKLPRLRKTPRTSSWSKKVAENNVVKVAIASLAKVACSLADILGGPESAIGYINIDCKASALTIVEG